MARLPGVVDEGGLRIALKICVGDRDGNSRLIQIAQQKLRERVAAGMGGTLRCIGLEYEIAAGKLIAHLIEILAVVFEAEAERMFALNPGNVVDKLQRVVLIT